MKIKSIQYVDFLDLCEDEEIFEEMNRILQREGSLNAWNAGLFLVDSITIQILLERFLDRPNSDLTQREVATRNWTRQNIDFVLGKLGKVQKGTMIALFEQDPSQNGT